MKNFSSSALLMTAALSLVAAGCGCEDHDPAPTVATAEVIRGSFVLEREGHEERVIGTSRVENEAEVRTEANGRGVVRLDSGAWILFDRSTTGTVELATLSLTQGRVWVDASSAEETEIVTSHGTLRASNATFAVDITDAGTEVYCGAGEITFLIGDGEGDRIAQGEQVVLDGSDEPEVEPAELWDDWTGGLADPGRTRYRESTYLGVLAGRPANSQGQARTPLPIRNHEVNVSIQQDMATTEVVQTFFNARSEILEGEWAIRIPRGAIVQEFAIDQGQGFQTAVVNAMQVGQGYQLSWTGWESQGAKLTYDGPDGLRARVYPIEPGGTVSVRLRYTEWLDRRGDRRTYVYPMRVEAEPPLLGEFILRVDATGTPVGRMRAGMGATTEDGQVVLRKSDFRPRADFYLDLYDEEAPPSDVVQSYQVTAPAMRGGGLAAEGNETYILFDIPTEDLVEEEEGDAPPLELVMLVDISGETDPEDLEIARAVVEAVLRQLTPTDQVAIRLADVTAHAPENAPVGLVPATEENREALIESIASVHLGGATDLGRSLRDAGQLVAGRPRAAVLYLGDGLPTTGGLDATALRATLATLDAPPRFFGLAIGDGANLGLLRRLFDGHAHAVHERTEASRTVMGILAEAAQPTLRGVEVDLGESVERIYPRPPILVPNGGHLRLVGRLVGDLPETITISATHDGESVESSLTVQRANINDNGDIRRRWAQSRLAELIDQDAGREAMVDLGLRFALVSPWTSLVVGGTSGQPVYPVTGFDHDPLGFAWGVGGGAPVVAAATLTSDESGWRRRLRRNRPPPRVAPEVTWVSRVTEGDEPASTNAYGADGGLARAAVQRTLRTGERGPRGCYERRSIVRPDLAGEMVIQVEVDGQGRPNSVNIVRETLGDDDVRRCVQTEISGLRFPATGGTGTVTVQHTLSFQMPEREFGSRRQCSDASQQSLAVRRGLWQERLTAAGAGSSGAVGVWRTANRQCELPSWRAKSTLLHMMLRYSGGVRGQIGLYRAFRGSGSIADYLRRIILRSVRSPDDVMAVRAGLGLDVPLDWTLFSRLWKRDDDPAARLALVRRWLEVVPEEMDLRLRLLSLLEQTENLAEARRVARELRADPLADARVRTRIGEFWLRQDNEAEARRVFSEIVERTPLDPWARRRLGDLYRAHHWADDAYREYRTLARLRPGDGGVLLLLARAAADAGRIDEALRLEQRLSESTDPGVNEGAAGFARLWTTVRLARLKLDAETDEMRAAIRRRERQSGALREPPAIFCALTWRHPDDHPELLVRYPSTDEDIEWEHVELGGREHGIYAVRIREREAGDYFFELRRHERDEIRDLEAELTMVTNPGTAEEHIERLPVALTRETARRRYTITAAGELEEVEIPASER